MLKKVMIDYPVKAPYSLTVESLISALSTRESDGLSQGEASVRSAQFGLNIYKSQKPKSLWQMAFEQFNSPIVYLLFVAGFASLYFDNLIEAFSIFIVILVNAVIGFFMELQARISMKALKEMDISYAKVIRDGKITEIPSEQLTPGDLLVLESGDIVSGDGRIISSNGLQADESSLTGESFPVFKTAEMLTGETESSGAKNNMVYKGTAVMNGNAKVIITGIAEQTELGKISDLVGSSTQTQTPLDLKINKLTKKLIWITLSMTCIFAVSGLTEGRPWQEILKTSIALAVAAVPEGLPIVATVALAYGMLLMAKKNAIVKKLSSVETLGGVNVILTDKTGTLTENKITVEVLSLPKQEVNVSIKNGKLAFLEPLAETSKKNYDLLVKIGTLCNDAPLNPSDKKQNSGDPVEIALLLLADAAGFSAKETKNLFRRVSEIPFSSETKVMGTLHENEHSFIVSAKGSVENLLVKCSSIQLDDSIFNLNNHSREEILSKSEKMSAAGLRVLAFAYLESAEMLGKDYLQNLIYVGMIGFLDPPRMDIKDAISNCKSAGIKIVMITGDHPMTALNISKKVGITSAEDNNVIAGSELPEMDSLNQSWRKKILATSVFARTTPKQKLEIVDVYQNAGYIVAMTGDGVNDAPAIKKANVGIAMGLRGTQVAKETASIVLKDDSFTSISQAVAHGREIFQNIQRFVIYLVSCNLSEILIITVLGFLAPGSILFPLQILFLNLITDVFPALALGLGKGDKTVMQKPPRDPKKDIISNQDWMVILIYALLMTSSILMAIFSCRYFVSEQPGVINNVAFLTLTLCQLFHVFNMASTKSGMIVNEITKNKYVWIAFSLCLFILALAYVFAQSRIALNLNFIPAKAWLIALLASIFPLFFAQLYKFLRKQKAW